MKKSEKVRDPLRIQKNYVKGLIDEIDDNEILGRLYYFINGYLDANDDRKSLIQLRGSKSIEEVAKALDISVKALTAYEERIREPRDEVKVRISKYYGVPNYYGKYIKNAAPEPASNVSCI